MNIYKKTVLRLLGLPIYLISLVLPKRKNIWVFGCWQGKKFSDNARSLAIHCSLYENDLRAVWIYKDRSIVEELRHAGVTGFYYLSLKGIVYQLIAGVAFITHTVEDDLLGFAIGRKTLVVQLWHGTPLKKILHDDDSYHINATSFLVRISRRIFPWTNDRWDWVISSSEQVSQTLRTAFATDNVVITGYPRNDSFTHSAIGSGPVPISKIIYMPTFRGKYGSDEMDEKSGEILDRFGLDFQSLDARLKDLDCYLTIRLHPAVKLPNGALLMREGYERIRFDEERKDIYSLIDDYDLLVTDYSSIVFDFVLTGKPVIMVGLDLEEYTSGSRKLYYEFSSLCPNAELRTWEDILIFIEECKNKGLSPEYLSRYNYLLRLFNKWSDESSSVRVISFVKSILGKTVFEQK